MLTFSSGLAAGLAAAANRTDWCNLIISTLGPTRAVEFKSALSGNPFPSGTTFFAAPVTGTMTAANGKVAGLGKLGAPTTRVDADLSNRVAAMRFSGGGEWVQGTVGLTMATIGHDGQPVDFVLRRNPNGTYGYTLNGAKFTAPANLGTPDVELYQLAMVNETGAEQPADIVSPMFGVPFVQGKIPQGTYPQFRVGASGPVCPPTFWGVTSWPDGSMKFCCAMVRIPVPVAAGGTLNIGVRSGGSAPAAGARSPSDLVASDIKTELIGVTELTGTWTAGLNDAISTGTPVLLGSGPAGSVWRIRNAAVRNASAAAHEQLVCDHYFAALTNASGGLQGVLYLGRIGQPWADWEGVVQGATPALFREFTGSVKRGATTIRSLVGLRDTTTPGEVIRLQHYGSFFTAGPDGKWDYFQGGGTSASASVLRVKPNSAYFKLTGLLPPLNLNLPSPDSVNRDYVAMGIGLMHPGMGAQGDRNDIGIVNEWQARHILSPTAANEKINRVHGLMAGGWKYNIRQRATGQLVASCAPRASYAGLGTIRTTWTINGSTITGGAVQPSPNTAIWAEDVGHRPANCYWAYLFTGEPQFLDLLEETAFSGPLQVEAGTGTWGTDFPNFLRGSMRNTRIGAGGTVYPGGGLYFYHWNGVRASSWMSRDVACAAAIMPDVDPEGVEKRLYLRDVVDSANAAALDYFAKMPASFSNMGVIALGLDSSPWMEAYFRFSMSLQSAILPGVPINQLRDRLSKLYSSYQLSNSSMGGLISYRIGWRDGQLLVDSSKKITALFGNSTNQGNPINFSAETNRGTITNGTYTPSDGDTMYWPGEFGTTKPIPSDADYTLYYAVNCSGKTFQLSKTLGGAPLTIPADITCTQHMFNIANLGSEMTPHYDLVYHKLQKAAINYLMCEGAPSLTAAKNGTDPILDAKPTTALNGDPYTYDTFLGPNSNGDCFLRFAILNSRS